MLDKAMARSDVKVVTVLWIQACYNSKELVNEAAYLYSERDKEKVLEVHPFFFL